MDNPGQGRLGNDHHVVEELRITSGELLDALATRDLIGQAKGVIRSLTGCADETAVQLLTKLSLASDCTLPEVADLVLASVGRRHPVPGAFGQAYARGLKLIRERDTLDHADLSTGRPDRGPG